MMKKKNAVYVTYFVKKNKHAKFIIGKGKRLSVLGQKNINKIKTLKKNMNRKNRTKKR